jgi:hypothetical protein
MLTNVTHGPQYKAVFDSTAQMLAIRDFTDHGLRTATLGLVTSFIDGNESAEGALEQIAGALDALEACLASRAMTRELSNDSPFFVYQGAK